MLRMNACACAGSWPLNADEMSGSPRSASTALKRMFDGRQPIELKTRTTLTAVHASMLDVDVASICAVFSASTMTSPTVVVTLLDSIRASVPDSTTFVTMTAPKPSHGTTVLESLASMNPPPVATTEREAALRLETSSTCASVTLRTSLWSTRPKYAFAPPVRPSLLRTVPISPRAA